MPDAGEIKAKVTIEYDGSGVDKAKDDLASLAELGKEGSSSGNAMSDALSNAEEQIARTADEAAKLNTALAEVPKTGGDVTDSVAAMNDELAASEEALTKAEEGARSLQEQLTQTPSIVDEAAKSLDNLNKPLNAVAENAATAQQQIDQASQSQQQFNDAITSATTQVLPQHVQSVQQANVAQQQLAENLNNANDALTLSASQIKEALSIPQDQPIPADFFSQASNAKYAPAIESYVNSMQNMGSAAQVTGQQVQTLNDVIAANGEAARNAPNSPYQTYPMSPDQARAQAAYDSPEGQALLAQYKSGAGSMDYEGMISEMDAYYGSKGMESFLGSEFPLASKGTSLAEGFGNTMGLINEGLSQIMMPMFAIQMGSMFAAQLGQGIYDAASIAEGPAAHSFGTFTGTVDALGQSMSTTSQQFSEGFGQQIRPALEALNYGFANNTSGTSQAGGIVGLLTGLGIAGTQLAMYDFGGAWRTSANTFASMLGQPLPYQGPGPVDQAIIQSEQAQANMPHTVQALGIQAQTQAMQYQDMAGDQTYLQQQDYLQASQQYYQTAQTRYNNAHHITQQQIAQDVQAQDFQQQEQQFARGGPPPNTPGSWTQSYTPPTPSLMDDITSGFNNLLKFSLGMHDEVSSGTAGFLGSGCFPAGTLITLPDGSEHPIETIKIHDAVMSHDGSSASVSAIMKFINKIVFTIIFDDGSSLRLTDSHPVATPKGWASLSPIMTEQENPGLNTIPLQSGMDVTTYTLEQKRIRNIIQEPELQTVYNFTVEKKHTYIANRVIVHNMAKTSFNVDSGGAATVQAHVNWVADSLEHTFEGKADWTAEGLFKQFMANAEWAATGLYNQFMAMAEWVADGLEHSFIGQAIWQAIDLAKDFIAQAFWSAVNLEQKLEAVATWAATGLEHNFEAVATWTAQNLNPVFNVAASFIGLPGFAAGVEGFSGGAAMVGESGPELVILPQGASVYPLAGSGQGGGAMATLGSMASSQSQAPQTINLAVMLDSNQFISAMGIPLASFIRVSMGGRSI